jgi:hypothetical protein
MAVRCGVNLADSKHRVWDSAVVTATSYGLDGPGFKSGFSTSGEATGVKVQPDPCMPSWYEQMTYSQLLNKETVSKTKKD